MLLKYANKIRKLSAAALIMVMTTALSTGCSSNAYELYKKAEEKTESAKSGIYDMTIKMDSEIDTSGMTEEQLKSINYIKQFEFKGKTAINKEKDETVSDAWINLGGIGFDFTYYGKGEEQYIKYPVLKKYIDLKTLMNSGGTEATAPTTPAISENTQTSLATIWNQLATKETVKSVEDEIIATQAGDIKAKHLVIEVSGDAIKQALTDSQKILLLDPSIQNFIKNQLEKAAKESIANSSNENITEAFNQENIVLLNEEMEIESYVLSSYIDADGYMVKDEVEIVIGGFGSNVPLKKMTFNLSTIYSDLNQPVEIDFPEITPDQVFTPEELNQEMPSVFKDFIQ